MPSLNHTFPYPISLVASTKEQMTEEKEHEPREKEERGHAENRHKTDTT